MLPQETFKISCLIKFANNFDLKCIDDCSIRVIDCSIRLSRSRGPLLLRLCHCMQFKKMAMKPLVVLRIRDRMHDLGTRALLSTHGFIDTSIESFQYEHKLCHSAGTVYPYYG